jgi:hypothetical protein
MTSSIPEQPSPWPAADEVPTDELARRQGVRPITSVEDIKALARPEAWESDEEFTDFLTDLYASRHSDVS